MGGGGQQAGAGEKRTRGETPAAWVSACFREGGAAARPQGQDGNTSRSWFFPSLSCELGQAAGGVNVIIGKIRQCPLPRVGVRPLWCQERTLGEPLPCATCSTHAYRARTKGRHMPGTWDTSQNRKKPDACLCAHSHSCSSRGTINNKCAK